MTRLTAGCTLGTATLIALVASFAVHAQQSTAPGAAPPAPREIPRPDQLEPGVDTTKSPPPPAPGGDKPAAASAAASPAAAAAPAGAAESSADAAKSTATAKNIKGKSGPDRLELGATDVRGNSELPTVMYVVPWKRSDLGDLVGKPVNSLVDEVLQPLDRDVFRRENRYYEAVKPEGAGAKADAAQGSAAKP